MDEYKILGARWFTNVTINRFTPYDDNGKPTSAWVLASIREQMSSKLQDMAVDYSLCKHRASFRGWILRSTSSTRLIQQKRPHSPVERFYRDKLS